MEYIFHKNIEGEYCMKTWKHFTVFGILAIIAIIAIIFVFSACDNGNGKTHTHDWKWVVTTEPTTTADGLETETCTTCGETRDTRPISAIAKPFFGTWVDNESERGGILTLTAILFNIGIPNDNEFMRINNPIWIEATNENVDTKDEYPSGYKLSGTWSENSSYKDSELPIIFINSSKNKLCLWGDSGQIFTKQ